MRCHKDFFTKGSIFHVYNHAVEKENLFRVKADYEKLQYKLKKGLSKFPATILAYCLMPNHYHFLIRQDSDIPLYKLFNSIFVSYVQSYNHKYKRKGRLFRSHLQHIAVNSDVYLKFLCHYIHYNPVKHGLVEAVEDWPWSTYHRFVRDGFYEHRVLNDYDGNFGEDFAAQ